MRVKSLLLVVVLNIFLSLALSVMFEFNDLQERITTMENTITECITMAVDTATASEEVFSDNYQNKIGNAMYSFGETENAERTSNSLLVYDKSTKRCYYANVYMLAMWYTENGTLPTETEYKTIANDNKLNTTAGVYRYLFGETGSQYTSNSLKWANFSRSTIKAYNNWNSSVVNQYDKITTGRKANGASFNASGLGSERTRAMNDFTSFYNAVGKKITTRAIVKKKSGDSYEVIEEEFPTLAQMGLQLSSYNNVGNQLTHDTFTSVTHLGKKRLTGSSIQNSVYYFTPYSLGVTYIPQSVLESTFVANLDMMVRLQRVSSGYTEGVNDSVIKAMEGSTGCVPTSVFAIGDDEDMSAELDTDRQAASRLISVEHDRNGLDKKYIVNDGQIEYDLSSIQTKVDYKVVDFYDKSNAALVSAITGGVPAYYDNGSHKGMNVTSLRQKTIDKLVASDTQKKYGAGFDIDESGKRIVARVTVRMKCHILYKSPILQWVSYGTRDTYPENHYDIKLFDGKSGTIIETDDGVYYQYTTYKVVSR